MTRDAIPADELLTKAHAIGQYYGFTPLSALTATSRGAARKTPEYPAFLSQLGNDFAAETVTNFLKQFQRIEQVPNQRQPLFVWHTNIAPGRPAPKKVTIQLHALGVDHALADSVIIRAMMALTRDLFREEPVVRINSMGDKETRARYTRELGTFFKKRASTLPEEFVTCAKQDTMLAAELAIAGEYANDLPSPTEHLSDASRKRFEDLLEYLEMTDTPYELARTLLSRGNVWNDACFEIHISGRRVAWGSHYTDFTRHFFPSAFGASGAVIQVPSTGGTVKKISPPKLSVSFIHIGNEAKRVSLQLAEEFRKARVGLTQHIGIESLTEQLHLAERQASPYLLIMGRKEAMEGSAILRNRKTQEETLIPLTNIIDRLRSVA